LRSWAARKLEHSCRLTFAQIGQENGLPIGKLQGIVVNARLVLADCRKIAVL
jgi:hypothetical protein